MQKAMIVTGTPGTGKSWLSKKLAKLHRFKHIDVSRLIKNSNLSEGRDAEMGCEIIDTKNLKARLIEEIKKNKGCVIIDSHMSQCLPKKYVKAAFAAKCNIGELNARLGARGYSKKKIRENLDAEIFDVCATEAQEAGHTVIRVDTSSYAKKRVMVFGTFDHLHRGHVFFMKKAKRLGDELIIVVARDVNVAALKSRTPVKDEKERLRNCRKLGIGHRVILGDQKDLLARVIAIKPDVIALGYDQQMTEKVLAKRLEPYGIKPNITRLPCLNREYYRSSRIRGINRTDTKY